MNQRISQLDRTRHAIIEAASAMVFGEADPQSITMQAIADSAGVSHRTLYRHFPSRRELINAVGAEIDAAVDDAAPHEVLESFDRWVSSIPQIVGFGATHRETLRRGLAVGIASGEFRTDRDDRYWALFQERFPHLDPDEARQDFVALRHLLGSSNVILMGERFAMSPDEIIPAMERSVASLLADIERRNIAAARHITEGASS
jgi:AcrR family transcriptional regulator